MSSKRVLIQRKGSLLLGVISLFLFNSCTLLVTRPVQEMSYTAAALKAAREVQADVLAPELLRQADEFFFHAKRNYKLKNFYQAKKEALKALALAEKAESTAIQNGGDRAVNQIVDPYSEGFQKKDDSTGVGAKPSSPPYSYPHSEGIPADVYEQRKSEEEQRKFELEKIKAQQPVASPVVTQPIFLPNPSSSQPPVNK